MPVSIALHHVVAKVKAKSQNVTLQAQRMSISNLKFSGATDVVLLLPRALALYPNVVLTSYFIQNNQKEQQRSVITTP